MTVSKDAGIGAFGIVFGIVLFVLSYQVKDFASVGVGAGFLPRFAAVFFILLGALLLLQGLRAPRGETAKKAESRTSGGGKPVALSLLLLIAYVALLQPIGFIISSAAYVFLQILILSKGQKPNYLLFALVSSVASVSAYFLFVRVFQVMIPAGILG